MCTLAVPFLLGIHSRHIQDKLPLSIVLSWSPCERCLFGLLHLIFKGKRIDFVLSSPKWTLSLLSTDQSSKVGKPQFRCFSIIFISLCWKNRQELLACNSSSLSTARCWYRVKTAVNQKLNLVANHMILKLHLNTCYLYW